MDKYEKALRYAEKKHNGQKRIGGAEYITHPIAVAALLRDWGYSVDFQIAGLFHDLLEDTDATECEILSLGGEAVLEAVKLLTKPEEYEMESYVGGILNNEIARAVKTADRLHNLRCAGKCDDDFKKKYILESIRWYIGFSDEIKSATVSLFHSMQNPDIECKNAISAICD